MYGDGGMFASEAENGFKKYFNYRNGRSLPLSVLI